MIAAGLIRVQPLGICPRDPSFQLVLGAEHAERLCEGEEMALVKAAARNKTWRPFHRLLVLNKPRGCVSERPRQPRNGASPKNGARDTVYDLIPPSLAHTSLGAFGRLDKDTTGLLMLGSDGGLQSLLTHPCTSLPKRYEALIKAGRISVSAASKQDEGVDEVEWQVPCSADAGDEGVSDCVSLRTLRVLADGAAAAFAAGVELPDGTRCRPAELEVLATGFVLRGAPESSDGKGPGAIDDEEAAACDGQVFWGPLPADAARWLRKQREMAGAISPVLRVALTLHEGIFHQVKRMFGTVGAHVVLLHRAAVGPVTLGALALGAVREVREDELAALAALLPADEAARSNASRGTLVERGGGGGPRGRQRRKEKRARAGSGGASGDTDNERLAAIAAQKRARGLLQGQAKRAQRAALKMTAAVKAAAGAPTSADALH